jgi:hypothetical protein
MLERQGDILVFDIEGLERQLDIETNGRRPSGTSSFERCPHDSGAAPGNDGVPANR